jgi:hypothetical protein
LDIVCTNATREEPNIYMQIGFRSSVVCGSPNINGYDFRERPRIVDATVHLLLV